MKKRYSEKERLDILEEVRKSDLSVVNFVREKCIPASTIFTCLKREKESKQIADKSVSQKNKNTLVEVVVPKETEKEKILRAIYPACCMWSVLS